MQFHVPQFIDVEDKIFGPLSFKQFVYLIGGAGLCVILYTFIPYKLLAFPLIILVAAFSIALAFYRVNDKPFIYIVQAAFAYVTSSQLYLWKKQEHKNKSEEEEEEEEDKIQRAISTMSLSSSGQTNLGDKSFSIDVGNESPPVQEKEPKHISPNRSPS